MDIKEMTTEEILDELYSRGDFLSKYRLVHRQQGGVIIHAFDEEEKTTHKIKMENYLNIPPLKNI